MKGEHMVDSIQLKEITLDNLRAVCQLSDTLTPQQQQCVSSNAYSIAQAHYCKERAWFRAIYLEDEPIGFVMVDVKLDEDKLTEDEKPSVMLWRFMIARDFQGKGYGKKVLDRLVEKFRQASYRYFFTSCRMGEGSPYHFYLSYGFKDTGLMQNDEKILSFKLT